MLTAKRSQPHWKPFLVEAVAGISSFKKVTMMFALLLFTTLDADAQLWFPTTIPDDDVTMTTDLSVSTSQEWKTYRFDGKWYLTSRYWWKTGDFIQLAFNLRDFGVKEWIIIPKFSAKSIDFLCKIAIRDNRSLLWWFERDDHLQYITNGWTLWVRYDIKVSEDIEFLLSIEWKYGQQGSNETSIFGPAWFGKLTISTVIRKWKILLFAAMQYEQQLTTPTPTFSKHQWLNGSISASREPFMISPAIWVTPFVGVDMGNSLWIARGKDAGEYTGELVQLTGGIRIAL